MTAPTRLSGDIKTLQRDMVKLVTKRIRQLDRTVNALLAGDVVSKIWIARTSAESSQ